MRLQKFAGSLWDFDEALHGLTYDLGSELAQKDYWSADEDIFCPPRETEVDLQLAPGQQCDIPYPGLSPAKPFHDPRGFPWWQSFTEQTHVIVEEFDLFLKGRGEEQAKAATSSILIWDKSKTELCNNTEGFSKLTLLNEKGDATLTGRRHFPETIALLQKVLLQGNYLAPRPVNINCQLPNTGLAPHSDNMNFLFTCHLGLMIPEKGKCIFRMASGETLGGGDYSKEEAPTRPCEVQWRRGQMVVADTSFVHSTKNESPAESRYVLSFSIWHPMLGEFERGGIVQLHDALQEAHRKTRHS